MPARRSLAEIYYRDVGDLAQAIEEYKALKKEDLTTEGRQEAGFTLAELYFKRNDLQAALYEFREVAANNTEPHLRDRANLKMGVIYQLQSNHQASITPYGQVINGSQCKECRYQARLGLVGAYEGQGDFDKALETLSNMDRSDGSEEWEEFKAREIKRIEGKRSVLQ